jgi:hypothetical protein
MRVLDSLQGAQFNAGGQLGCRDEFAPATAMARAQPHNCIDPSKISTHKLTHRKMILATPYSDWQPPLRM